MSKLIILSSVILFASFVLSADSTFGNGLFICKDGKLAPGEKFATKLKACNEPSLYVDRDIKCISVCTTDALGGLKDGIPDKDLFLNIVKTEFPEAEQATALGRVEKCFENRTFDKDDKTCAAIADFSACGTKLVIETSCTTTTATSEAS